MRLRIFLPFLVVLLAACGGSDPVEEDVPIVQVYASYYAEWPVRNYVIRDAEAWAAVWREPVSMGDPRPELPVIDFSAQAIVGVAQGWNTGCGGFGIKRVTRRGADLQVQYGTTPPPPNTGCMGSLIPAVYFITVPLPLGNVEFILRDV